MANARLGWFSPLGVAASIRASARRVGLRVHRFRFGVAAGRVRSSAFRFGVAAQRVGLRGHRFRFSACAASEWLLGELVLLPSVSEMAARRVGLRAHDFRFSARTASEIALGGLVLPPSVSEITAGRVGLRIHCFRFSACTDSGVPSAGWFFRLPFRRLPSAGWPSGSLLPLFGTHRFGGALGGLVLPLGGLAFGFTASAFRHAPLRKLPSAGWPSGSPLLLFGTHRSAPPHRRSEDRRSTPTRHLFHFKTLIPTC